MQYLTLEELKKQIVIDEDFTEDDAYLEMVGDAAEDMCSQLLDCPLDLLAAEYGDIPPVVKHACRMLADYFYAVNRGSAENDKEIPNAVYVMLKLYRNYL